MHAACNIQTFVIYIPGKHPCGPNHEAPMGTYPGYYTVCVKRDSYVHERKPLITESDLYTTNLIMKQGRFISTLIAMHTHTYHIHSSVPVFNNNIITHV